MRRSGKSHITPRDPRDWEGALFHELICNQLVIVDS
jgi:hypothetical protein